MQSQEAHPETTQSPPVEGGSDTGSMPSLDAPVLEKQTQQDQVIEMAAEKRQDNITDIDFNLASSSQQQHQRPPPSPAAQPHGREMGKRRVRRMALLDIEMGNDSNEGSRDLVLKSELHHDYQQPDQPFHPSESADQPPPPSESVKAMRADFYGSLRAGKIDAVRRMLEDEEECLLGQVTPQLNTPLHIAASRGLDQLIKLILTRRDSLLTEGNVNRELALHLAAGEGHLKAVETIAELEGKTDFSSFGDTIYEMRNKDGDTALHLAVRHKHREVARFLISVCPNASYHLNGRSESPLFVAAELGELELVRAMLEAPVNVDVRSALENGKSVLVAAISGENLGVLEALLSKHKFLNSSENSCVDGVYPLSYAASKGNLQTVHYLLTQFPDCNYKRDSKKIGTFPIHVAAARGHKEVLEEFLRFHPDSRELLTSNGGNILHLAADQGKDDMVRYILNKPDVEDLINARDHRGNTPLHYAVSAKYPMVVDALTWDKRVKLDLVNKQGQTARDVALNFANSNPSLKERLTWLALRYAGAPRKMFIDNERSKEPSNTDNFKDRVNTLSVVATLVVTMTFAAGFTLPGGNNGSEPHLGMANFLKRRIFQLFVICNSIALYTSVLDVLILIFAMLGDVKLLQVSLKFAIPLLAISLATMSISFMSAAYLVVSTLKWLGIVIWALGSIFLALVLALFVLLFPPLSAKNRFTRYILYVPFRVMLYICEGK